MSLIAHYPLHGNARDVEGTNDGTNNGATETSGILGTSAYDFDPSNNDYVDVGALGYSGGNITISAWAKGGLSTTDTLVFCSDSNYINLAHNRNNEVYSFEIYDGSATRINGFDTDEWTFLCGVFDSKNGTMKFWQGAETTPFSKQGEASSGETTQDYWVIGAQGNDTTARNWDGKIADVRVYDHALSPLEVQYLYEVGEEASFTSQKKTL